MAALQNIERVAGFLAQRDYFGKPSWEPLRNTVARRTAESAIAPY